MLNYSRINKRNYKFLDDLFNLSSDNHEFGIAYPRGDLEDIISEFEDYDQKFDESFYIVRNNKKDIGIIGYIVEEKDILLVGPIFEKKYHKKEIFSELLPKFIKNEIPIYSDRVIVYVINENKEMINALKQIGFNEKTKHLSMSYDVDQFLSDEKFNMESIKDISQEDINDLKEIRILFEENMPYEIDDTVNKFLEYLEDNYKISVLTVDDKLVGFIVWKWYNDLHFGRIDYLCVDKAYQKKGHGKKLVDYTINEICKVKIDTTHSKVEFNLLHIGLSQSNFLALKVYTNLGFKIDYFYSEYEFKIY